LCSESDGGSYQHAIQLADDEGDAGEGDTDNPYAGNIWYGDWASGMQQEFGNTNGDSTPGVNNQNNDTPLPQVPTQPQSVDQSVNAVPAAPQLDFTPIEQNNEAENPLANIQYTDKVKEQMASGDYHSFPESVDAFGADGTITTITGGDGVERTEVEIPGSYQGKEGVFQYIIEPDGVTCNHRLFVPNQ
jgi:hypothetical protein